MRTNKSSAEPFLLIINKTTTTINPIIVSVIAIIQEKITKDTDVKKLINTGEKINTKKIAKQRIQKLSVKYGNLLNFLLSLFWCLLWYLFWYLFWYLLCFKSSSGNQTRVNSLQKRCSIIKLYCHMFCYLKLIKTGYKKIKSRGYGYNKNF
jgi:hypothetical protein